MKTTKHPVSSKTLILTTLFYASAFTQAQLISNGGFEVPNTPTVINLSAGNTLLTPWVINSGNVDVVDALGNGELTGNAAEGSQYLDLNGSIPGKITQQFSTTVGLIYELTFAYADNNFPPGDASAQVRIFDASGTRLSQTFTHSTSDFNNLDWTGFSGQFTAFEDTTSLEFTSISPNNGHGILLDAVNIVPEPSCALSLLSGAAVICLRRRKVGCQ